MLKLKDKISLSPVLNAEKIRNFMQNSPTIREIMHFMCTYFTFLLVISVTWGLRMYFLIEGGLQSKYNTKIREVPHSQVYPDRIIIIKDFIRTKKSWTHVINLTFRHLTHICMMIHVYPYIIIKGALRLYDVSHIFSFRLRIVLRMTIIWIYLEFLYRDNSHICTQKPNVELR